MSAPVEHQGKPPFDSFSHDYDAALNAGLAYSGENPEYFARGRVAWLAHCLKITSSSPRSLLDYGCGKGSTTPLFFELLGIDRLLGVDISAGLLKIARETQMSALAQFASRENTPAAGDIDLAFCNGVFHHIPPADRSRELSYIFDSLKPGGLFAMWDNNPWNPATRFVMSRIAFDADAETLSAPHARRLLSQAGFEVLRTDYMFIFPRLLSWLRFLEPPFAPLPLGTQYQVLCRKPS